MATRVCEFCLDYFATSSELLTHYRKEHKDDM
jgi:hypothetical protein